VTPPGWSPPAGLPLAGLRVLELTANMIGPLAGRYLADLGAEVIKVESPRRPATRIVHYAGGDPRNRPYNRAGYFNKHNRNKLGITLDLSLPAGREQFLRLLERADVVIENNSARVLSNLDLTYEVMQQVKPDIILCSMSGFGGSGPERDYLALGSSIETVCGLASLTGYPDDSIPHRTGNFYPDPVGAAQGVVAILAALRHRDRTGEGQWIDLSMLESAAALFGEALMDWFLNHRVPARRGNRHPLYAPQGVYPSAGNDSWLALTVRDEQEWQALCRAIGRPDLAANAELATSASRRARHDMLDDAIGEWSRTLDHYEAARTLQSEGVPAAPVLANWEMFSDPHLFERGFFVPVPHPEVGVMPFPGFPWSFSRTPATIRGGAPCFAEHNALVFGEVLGLSDQEIAALYAEGVAADTPLVTVQPALGRQ
jgi:crotonobetainyl-CoA:carnitine CoA-transferase CaiB-like acyl-CoA transferase